MLFYFRLLVKCFYLSGHLWISIFLPTPFYWTMSVFSFATTMGGLLAPPSKARCKIPGRVGPPLEPPTWKQFADHLSLCSDFVADNWNRSFVNFNKGMCSYDSDVFISMTWIHLKVSLSLSLSKPIGWRKVSTGTPRCCEWNVSGSLLLAAGMPWVLPLRCLTSSSWCLKNCVCPLFVSQLCVHDGLYEAASLSPQENGNKRLFWCRIILKPMHTRGLEKVHGWCILWKHYAWISRKCTKICLSFNSIFHDLGDIALYLFRTTC